MPFSGRPIRAVIVASKLTSALPLVWKRILLCKNSAYTQPRDQTSAAKLYRRIRFCLDDASTAMALPIADKSGSTKSGDVLPSQAGETSSNTSGARYKQVQKLRVSVGRTLCRREQPKSEILAVNRPPWCTKKKRMMLHGFRSLWMMPHVWTNESPLVMSWSNMLASGAATQYDWVLSSPCKSITPASIAITASCLAGSAKVFRANRTFGWPPFARNALWQLSSSSNCANSSFSTLKRL